MSIKPLGFVWVKLNKKAPSFFWGMGAYTRANAEVCLLGISKGTKAKQVVKDNGVHQIIESPVEEHSKKPAETRDRINKLLGCGGGAYKNRALCKANSRGLGLLGK